jgi:hypothetical protein
LSVPADAAAVEAVAASQTPVLADAAEVVAVAVSQTPAPGLSGVAAAVPV